MIWFESGQMKSESIKYLISILKELPTHGINQPQDITSEIENLYDSINSYESDEVLESLERVFTLEKYCTYIAYNLIKGMHYGFTSPRELFGKKYDIELLDEDSLFQQHTLTTLKKNPNTTLTASFEANETYKQIREQYQTPFILTDSIYSNIKFHKNRIYKLDDKDEIIKKITEKLNFLGYYNDTITDIFTNKLLSAINELRIKHALPEIDYLSIETIDILNTTPEYFREKIKANLERYRLKRKKKDSEKLIFVNIATQDLLAIENNKISNSMRAVVRSKKSKTPMLESRMSFINLNPFWNVPKNIATKEILLKQQKDSTYIDRLGFEIYERMP